jgi:6-phosphogluconolactonase
MVFWSEEHIAQSTSKDAYALLKRFAINTVHFRLTLFHFRSTTLHVMEYYCKNHLEQDHIMGPVKPEIQVVENTAALSRKAAEMIIRLAAETLEGGDVFTITLSGGSTPKSLFTLLSTDASLRNRIPWEKIHFFWGDERHVAPDHRDSNYRIAYEVMLSRVPVPPQNIHRVPAEHPDAIQSAEEYEQELRRFFNLETGELPRFDCVLLGMGPDGHTASLFPETEALQERERLVVANWVEKFRAYRITMTVPVLNHADHVSFLVSGEEKAGILKQVLEGEKDPKRFPSQLIEPTHGKLVWIVDEAAATRLTKK